MANEKHLAILHQGVAVWNEWRKEHPRVEPKLEGIDLEGVNLQGANLSFARLSDSELSKANLRGVILTDAEMYNTGLVEVDLRGANLGSAEVAWSDLQRANLREADLNFTEIRVTELGGAIFADALFDETRLINVDLSTVQGLAFAHHYGPSSIDFRTLYNSKGQIPEIFLRGCGVPDTMIEYARSLVAAERPIDYYSCFISHSSHDKALAERLYADLQSKGVRCWLASEDLKIGEPILSGIDRGIRIHDKLLLILSEASVESGWVEQEVHMALAREKTERRRVLFPIRIDDAVIASRQGWPAVLRNTIHIGDFRQWKEHDAYQSAFARLLRDLKAEKAE